VGLPTLVFSFDFDLVLVVLFYGLLGIAHRGWLGFPLDCNAVGCAYAWIGGRSSADIIRMK